MESCPNEAVVQEVIEQMQVSRAAGPTQTDLQTAEHVQQTQASGALNLASGRHDDRPSSTEILANETMQQLRDRVRLKERRNRELKEMVDDLKICGGMMASG